MNYRPEIDGLRAIAVISVIVYHAEFIVGGNKLLTGGFLGVDVFFVISGFLITSLMMKELRLTGTVSISHFYERRARRLLPVLFTVIFSFAPLAWLFLLPEQFVDYAKSILSSLFFLSNFYWDFSLQQYGAESGLFKPFLHTWSLAVEEQYYILFPLLFLALCKWSKVGARNLLLIGLVSSLIFAEWKTRSDVSFSFYMLPSRLWELLAGALLAMHLDRTPGVRQRRLEVERYFPALGVLLIAFSFFFIDMKKYDHPGFVTLLPVLGAVLIIGFSNEKDVVTKLLSSRPFVSVGLISYSLYLWHYPLFSFFRIYSGGGGNSEFLLLIVLAVVLSVISYHLVEKRFRAPAEVGKSAFFAGGVASTLLVAAFCTYVTIFNGVESRLGEARYVFKGVNSFESFVDGSSGKPCHPAIVPNNLCSFPSAASRESIVLLGDSHAGALGGSLSAMAVKNQFGFFSLTANSCPMLPSVKVDRRGNADFYKRCNKVSREAFDLIESLPSSIIVYSARLPFYVEGTPFDNREGGVEYVNDEFSFDTFSGADVDAELIDDFQELIKYGHKLVIVYPVPEVGWSVPLRVKSELGKVMQKLSQNMREMPVTTSYALYKERSESAFRLLDRIAGEHGEVMRIYPDRLLCSQTTLRCYTHSDQVLFYKDSNHLSTTGAEMVVSEVERVLTATLGK